MLEVSKTSENIQTTGIPAQKVFLFFSQVAMKRWVSPKFWLQHVSARANWLIRNQKSDGASLTCRNFLEVLPDFDFPNWPKKWASRCNQTCKMSWKATCPKFQVFWISMLNFQGVVLYSIHELNIVIIYTVLKPKAPPNAFLVVPQRFQIAGFSSCWFLTPAASNIIRFKSAPNGTVSCTLIPYPGKNEAVHALSVLGWAFLWECTFLIPK